MSTEPLDQDQTHSGAYKYRLPEHTHVVSFGDWLSRWHTDELLRLCSCSDQEPSPLLETATRIGLRLDRLPEPLERFTLRTRRRYFRRMIFAAAIEYSERQNWLSLCGAPSLLYPSTARITIHPLGRAMAAVYGRHRALGQLLAAAN